MKTVVSLFDMTGNMVRPWAEAGFNCYCFDIQNDNRVDGNIHYMKADLYSDVWREYIKELNPDMLFAFPPCTDLAVSGASHFKKKAAANPNYRAEAMALVYLARDIGEAVGCPYMIENPISVISSEWRKPDHKFHPHQYGGYLPEDDTHPDWPEYIAPRDAYPKLTCLWTGNGFTMPDKRPVAVPEGFSAQYKKLGGKSIKTKNIRSATPRGFALAVYENSLK